MIRTRWGDSRQFSKVLWNVLINWTDFQHPHHPQYCSDWDGYFKYTGCMCTYVIEALIHCSELHPPESELVTKRIPHFAVKVVSASVSLPIVSLLANLPFLFLPTGFICVWPLYSYNSFHSSCWLYFIRRQESNFRHRCQSFLIALPFPRNFLLPMHLLNV